MNKKGKILINTSDKKVFNGQLLRNLRHSRPYSKHAGSFRPHMSALQAAKRVGISVRQMTRYEANIAHTKSIEVQTPSLGVFKKLCLLYQCDPKDLLGLVWVDEELVVDNEVVLDPTDDFVVPKIICETCKRLVIDNDPIRQSYEERAHLVVNKKKAKRGTKKSKKSSNRN